MWLYPGETGNWHFISLPKKAAAEIKKSFGGLSRGWGSLRIEAIIGKTSWKTSVFPNKKRGTYVLPIKADVRKKEDINAGDKVKVKLTILV